MATATPAQQSAIVNLYVALFNRAPDAAGFEFWTQALANGAPLSVVTGAFFVSPETTAIYPAAQNAQAFVSAFYQTVFGRAPDAEGLVFWTNVLNAAGGPSSQSAKALLVSKIVDIVSAPLTEKPAGLTDAQYAETVHDRELFGKKNVAALDFAINVKSNDLDAAKQVLVDVVTPTTPTVPTPGPSEPVGLVIPLTINDETLSGANGNDTFDGKIVYDNLENRLATLNSGDVLDGGAGTDTLLVGLNNSDTVKPTLKNIEIISVKSIGYGTLDLSNAEGVKQIGFDGSSGSGEISHVGDAALFISNQTGDAYAIFRGTTAPTLSLSLTSVGTEQAPLDVYLYQQDELGPQATAHSIVANKAFAQFHRAESGAAVLDVTVAATGTNAIALSQEDAATVETVTVTGTGSVDFTGMELNALSAFTAGDGGVRLTSTNTAFATLMVTTGAGEDVIDAKGASIKSLNVGAGNDIVTLSSSALTAGAQVDLGLGDDILVLRQGSNAAAVIDGGDGIDTATFNLNSCSSGEPNLKNIEIVSLSESTGGTLDLFNSTGVTQVGFNANTTGLFIRHVGAAGLAVSNQTAAVYVSGSTASNLSLTLSKVGEAFNRTQVELSASGGAAAQATKHSIVADKAYVTFSEQQTSAIVTAVTVAATNTNVLQLSGADATTVTSLTVTGTGSVDFSKQALSALNTFTAQDGGVTLTSTNAAEAALTVTTGKGVDTIVANGANIKSLNVGAGNDVVTLDTEALSSTATVNLGAGDDTLTLAVVPTAGATIDGGDGVDTLVIGNATLTSDDYLALSAVKNVEVLALSSANPVIDAAQLTNFKGFSLNAGFGLSSISNLGADNSVAITASYVNTTLTAASGNTHVDVVVGGSADGLEIFGLDVQDFAAVTLTSKGTSQNHIGGFANKDDAVITVKGETNLGFELKGTSSGSKVDAALLTGKLTITGSGFADVIIGGSGDDSIKGGSGDDSINGGSGDDSINGGGGADTLTGGAGKDTFFINAGATQATADAIEDFTTGADKIAFSTAPVFEAAFSKGNVNTGSFDAALIAANAVLTYSLGGLAQVNVQRVDDDLYVFFNNGQAADADQVVKLVGTDLNEIAFADIGRYPTPLL